LYVQFSKVEKGLKQVGLLRAQGKKEDGGVGGFAEWRGITPEQWPPGILPTLGVMHLNRLQWAGGVKIEDRVQK
jgi:hypothetical protein